MKIIFMGTPSFAVPSLEKLLDTSHSVSSVVTSPDKPGGRGLKLSESKVKLFAKEKVSKILQPQSLKDESFIREIKNIKPDLIIVVAFRILPKEVFTIPRYGSINLHASLLPKYRGAAPINWAIIKGEKETGVTTFFLEEKVDTGKIILQNKCVIENDDNAGSLHDKLAILGAETLISTINLIERSQGNPPVQAQVSSHATPAPKITSDFCRINWNGTMRNVYNFIRGLSPHPAAYTFHKDNRLKIFKTVVSNLSKEFRNNTIERQGQLKILNRSLFVSCSDGFLEILELQLEGKKRLTINEFIKGYKLGDEDKFT